MKTLGIEISTQSGKAVILNSETGVIEHKITVNFDETFPEYNTVNGVFTNKERPEIRETSPLLLIEAFERLFIKLKSNGADFSEIKAVKVDGMQHCTVYLNSTFETILNNLKSGKPLTSQLSKIFTRQNAPIWEDRSTATEALALEESMKKHGGIAAVTGNRAELRFPAAQIMKWAKESPIEYANTAHIQLLSAFLTSILVSKISPVDTGDGFGTNINALSISKPEWDNRIVNIIEEYSNTKGLLPKLGSIVPFDTVVGNIGKYFVAEYGFSPEIKVFAGTGDNPATLMGSGGEAVISLGSSYTVNGIASGVKNADEESCNIFGFADDQAIALSCITNGGKIHDHFLKKYAAGDWKQYGSLCGKIELSENEPLMLPYLFDESVPRHKAGIIRDGFSESEPSVNVRALHISQALSLALHSTHLSGIKSIAIAGGGAKNLFLRQLISDFFQCDTFCLSDESYTAPIGCAISAASKKLTRIDKSTNLSPSKNSKRVIDKLLDRYKTLENSN
ncbi:MAG: hypothetical protein JNL74_03325 [Fibrobacteres bacterium]|nr:hypothetical protein [Fibrobacterota bacterium]